MQGDFSENQDIGSTNPSSNSFNDLIEEFEKQYHEQVKADVPMLDASQVLEIISSNTGDRSRLKRLRDSSSLIAVQESNRFVYPEFQFDRRNHSIYETVSAINRELVAASDPWGAIAWWTFAHSRLDGRRPIDTPDDPILLDLLTAEIELAF